LASGGDFAMAAAIARIIARVSTSDDFETLKLLTIFSLLGLLLCLISARFGLDTSWAFF
jgi:uncharacterized membrane protein YcaP (DUF421 family)